MDGVINFMSKIILAIFFIISTTTAVYYLIPQYKVNQDLKEQNEITRLELLHNKEEIAKKRNMIQDLHDNPAAIDRIAREKFGMCKPGERVYKFTDEDLFKKNTSYWQLISPTRQI